MVGEPGLEADVGILTMEARPGGRQGPERGQNGMRKGAARRQAAGGYHLPGPRLRPLWTPELSRAFNRDRQPQSQCGWGELVSPIPDWDSAAEKRGSRGGVFLAFLLPRPFCVSLLRG